MSFRTFSYSMFGWLGHKYRNDKDLGRDLNRGHMEMTPDAYVAWAATITLIVTLVSLVVGLIIAVAIIPTIEESSTTDPDEPFEMDPMIKALMVYGTLLGVPLLTIVYFKEISFGEFTLKGSAPAIKAKQRGNVADLYLPHAASFVSALSASNATMETIFYSLATQRAKKTGIEGFLGRISDSMKSTKDAEKDATRSDREQQIYSAQYRDVFPIISEECAAIYRDMTLLGVDALTAIQSAVERAPSPWLAEFFQGISSTISSGGNLKLYFLNSAERFMEDIKQQQKETLDQLATMAEMFVTVAVAMPIFLIIILIITLWVSTGNTADGGSLSTLYMVVFALVPLLHFMFATMTYLNIKKFQI
jgi:archaellum biogenesis protein FlaJ (TadC family)